MEDMRVDTMLDDSNPLGKDDPSIVRSPFDNELDIPFASNSLNPFSLSLESSNEIASPSSENPFKVPGENVDGIRKVTPIENPVMGMKGISPFVETIAEDTVSSISDKRSRFMGVDPDIVEIIPVGDSVGDDVVDDAGINSDGLPGDMGAMPVAGNILGRQDVKKPVSNKSDIDAEVNDIALDQRLSTGVLSSGLKDMKKVADKRFDDLESDINDLKSNLMSTTIQFSAIHGDAGSFSSKVSDLDGAFSSFVKSTEESLSQNNMKFDNLEEKTSLIEGRVGNIESTLGVLQSDNLSIRSDLTRIEDNVSELVNSYTALLAQLHESLQENESNFSRIDDVSGKLDQIGSKISSIEKSQEGTRSTSMEFSRSVSLLVDNIGKVSSEFLEFKQQSEAKNVSMLERIDSVTEYVESELKNLGARSYKGFGQNVHLSNIVKNSGNMKLCMEWLEFLMGLVGCNNLPDILAYYEELGWITEKVRMELLHYAEGIDFYMEKPDWKLTPDDHVKSIWFIESLAGMKVDKNRMSVIERDIEKVKNGSDIYGI
ncbi:FlaD/FlaE family flagellar protein [Methanolobus psychrotolerans]|uniref:FlaD/FlaE family flagellar protein n=1 Tax=Methanolobus psychrotolerans TaxID=1874706 RepID=UPI0013EB126C|nr:FlaD/FlaE family flagellar protein [Methanolobus psychrotolerans]